MVSQVEWQKRQMERREIDPTQITIKIHGTGCPFNFQALKLWFYRREVKSFLDRICSRNAAKELNSSLDVAKLA